MKMARLLRSKAVSQLLWSDKDREEWFSLGENPRKGLSLRLHQLRNCYEQFRNPEFRFPVPSG